MFALRRTRARRSGEGRITPQPAAVAVTLHVAPAEAPMKFTAVKLRRLERHLLQIEVAKRAALACSRLSAIENGDVEAQPDELQRIAVALDIPAQELQGH
jgi:hypothetical protein